MMLMKRAILMILISVTALATTQSSRGNLVVDLLKQGKSVFGSMASDRTEAGALRMAEDANVDFVFYDMERNYDLANLQTFLKAFRTKAQNKGVLVRIPPIGSDPEKARERVTELVAVGADGIVFPHIQDKRQAEQAVQWLNQSS